jgi:hypothetical protein
LAGNEALFREVNERVAEVSSHYEVETQTGAVDFTCECGLVDCAETMLMTIAEYEAIRAHATPNWPTLRLPGPSASASEAPWVGRSAGTSPNGFTPLFHPGRRLDWKPREEASARLSVP